MSLLKAIKAQLGLSNTPANNFTLDASADNGTLKLARGNAGATTQDILTVDAAGVVASVQGIRGGLFSGAAQATTSGTSIDFTGIPSWVKRITVMFNGVSTNGTAQYLLRIGAGSYETTGYLSTVVGLFNTATVTASNPTDGFGLSVAQSATDTLTGHFSIVNISGNSWVLSGSLLKSISNIFTVAGSKTISGTLDRILITTANGTDIFDAGSVNILYEG